MGQNATFIKITIDSKDLIGEISSSKSSSADVIDVSSKAGGRVRDILPGRVAESVSFESLADDTNVTDYGYATAYAAMVAGTLLDITIIRVSALNVQVTGSDMDTFKGYITSLTQDNPDNDRSTMSGTIEIDDASAVTVYTAPE